MTTEPCRGELVLCVTGHLIGFRYNREKVHRCKAVVFRNVGSFEMDDTWQRKRTIAFSSLCVSIRAIPTASEEIRTRGFVFPFSFAAHDVRRSHPFPIPRRRLNHGNKDERGDDMSKCAQCGNDLADDDIFCPKCGKEVQALTKIRAV